MGAAADAKGQGKVMSTKEEDRVDAVQYEDVWRKKNEEAIEEEFQKELRVCLWGGGGTK